MENYKQLEQEFDKISKINDVIAMLNWDASVNMPHGAAIGREQEIITLTKITQDTLKSEKIASLLANAKEEVSNLNQWQQSNLIEMERNIIDAMCIQDELQLSFISATTKCELIWRAARQDDDFNKVKPYLQEVVSYTKEIAAARAVKLKCSAQDALIDKYDPGRKAGDTKKIYQILKDKIPTLIQKIIEKQRTQKILPLPYIDINTQKAICRRLAEIVGFNLNKGRMDESAHPFCGGTPYDIRITNRYAENDLISGVMGIIHEAGHGLYEQGLPEIYINQPVGRSKGMAIHESQSLFMEMQVGRSKYFCEFLSKLLRDEFKLQGVEYESENLYRLVTKVDPGFIRVDADEVTYPLHIFLRFEIEELLINDSLTLDELPAFWNSKMEEYLNIRPTSNKVGCLQDIHWYSGSFGYFPAYTNGAIIASMLMAKAKALSPSITQEMSVGNISNLNKFLDDNIRGFGSLKSTKDLIKDATGSEDIDPIIFLTYLEQKYLS